MSDSDSCSKGATVDPCEPLTPEQLADLHRREAAIVAAHQAEEAASGARVRAEIEAARAAGLPWWLVGRLTGPSPYSPKVAPKEKP